MIWYKVRQRYAEGPGDWEIRGFDNEGYAKNILEDEENLNYLTLPEGYRGLEYERYYPDIKHYEAEIARIESVILAKQLEIIDLKQAIRKEIFQL